MTYNDYIERYFSDVTTLSMCLIFSMSLFVIKIEDFNSHVA